MSRGNWLNFPITVEGCTMRGLSVALIALFAAMPALAQQQVGHAAVVVKDVTGTVEAKARPLAQRDDVVLDELVETAAQSATGLVFLDGTNVSMGENSNLKLTKFVYDPRPSYQKMVVNAAQGVFRFTTGIFSKASYEVDTPQGTIGVRGTDFHFKVVGDELFLVVDSG